MAIRWRFQPRNILSRSEKRKVVKEGHHVTLVSHSRMVTLCKAVAESWPKRGFRVELIDLRTIKPLDIATIADSVRKTHRCVLVEEGHIFAGISAEVGFQIMEHCFDYLDAPLKRVAQRETPMPYSKALEKETMPTRERIIRSYRRSFSLEENMPFTLTMPKLSPTMEEGTIAKWRKKEGDLVKAGDVLFEVATDKATVEHNALDEGYLRKIIVKDGQTAVVNQPVAIFTEKS